MKLSLLLFYILSSVFISVYGEENPFLELFSSGTTCPCGTSNNKRIVGGDAASPNEFPFILAVVHSLTKQQFCGATILTPKCALTAAHCVLPNTPISVIAGAHDLRKLGSTTQESKVARAIIHEHYSYSKDHVVNDIAIFVLQTPLKLNSYVIPVCMPISKVNLENQMVTMLGWGKVGQYSEPSPILQKVDTEVITFAACKAKFNIDQTSQMCAFSQGKTACVGDSGGPAIYLDPLTSRYTLAGVVSHGDNSCTLPTVLSDVSTYISWVSSNIDGNTCHRV